MLLSLWSGREPHDYPPLHSEPRSISGRYKILLICSVNHSSSSRTSKVVTTKSSSFLHRHLPGEQASVLINGYMSRAPIETPSTSENREPPAVEKREDSDTSQASSHPPQDHTETPEISAERGTPGQPSIPAIIITTATPRPTPSTSPSPAMSSASSTPSTTSTTSNGSGSGNPSYQLPYAPFPYPVPANARGSGQQQGGQGK